MVTQEGNNPALTGKLAAIERLNEFLTTIAADGFVNYKIGDVLVEGNTSFYDSVLSLKLQNGETLVP
mgnify:CR=1 FL=1